MQKRNKVAFIIVCWNNEDLIEECFESIKKQTYKNNAVFLIDNGSKDNSVSKAKKLMPEANIIEAGANLGFAKGNNVAIKKALEDKSVGYVALINTDATLDSKWLERLVNFADSKPKSACLQGTTLDYYNHGIIDSTHIFLARNGQATQGSWRDYREFELGPKRVFGVNAAACLITRNFIEEQPFGDELFDEKMFMYLEDVDVAARATVIGWENYLVPGAVAYHMGSASSGKNPGYSLYMTFRNNTGMIIKNFPLRLIIRLIPRIVMSDIHTFKHLRRQGKQEAGWRIIKGRVIGIIRAPIFLKDRRKLVKKRNIDTEYLWHLMRKGY